MGAPAAGLAVFREVARLQARAFGAYPYLYRGAVARRQRVMDKRQQAGA
jgi:hypothetical protein